MPGINEPRPPLRTVRCPPPAHHMPKSRGKSPAGLAAIPPRSCMVAARLDHPAPPPAGGRRKLRPATTPNPPRLHGPPTWQWTRKIAAQKPSAAGSPPTSNRDYTPWARQRPADCTNWPRPARSPRHRRRVACFDDRTPAGKRQASRPHRPGPGSHPNRKTSPPDNVAAPALTCGQPASRR